MPSQLGDRALQGLHLCVGLGFESGDLHCHLRHLCSLLSLHLRQLILLSLLDSLELGNLFTATLRLFQSRVQLDLNLSDVSALLLNLFIGLQHLLLQIVILDLDRPHLPLNVR